MFSLPLGRVLVNYFVATILLAAPRLILAQPSTAKNLLIVTLDGFRWQEVFMGADSALLFNPDNITDPMLAKSFWDADPLVRRTKVLPFVWSVVENQGQLYGNGNYANTVNCANPYRASFPGYSEMFTGKADVRMHSNRRKENPNRNVLEALEATAAFDNKVAVFSSWNAFPLILGKSRAALTFGGAYTVDQKETNDTLTLNMAFEYLKKEKPRVLLISLNGTDEHGHGGRYDLYLKSAYAADRYIAMLWDWIQSTEEYKDKTTLFITTDHGRGQFPRNGWKVHGVLAPQSRRTWMVVMGPGVRATGEQKEKRKYFQKQIASTLGRLMGIDFEPGDVINEIVERLPRSDDNTVGEDN